MTPGDSLRTYYEKVVQELYKHGGSNKNRDSSIKLKSLGFLARQEGFEPPTYGFVVRHSIQLSYWRISLVYILQFCI